jgi:LacI family transcriptional regulator
VVSGETTPVAPTARIGVKEVAEEAGVSMSTVSRVLTNHPNVSSRTHERVMAAVEQLGYRPNALGQALRRGATRTIGFAITDISNPLFAPIALGAEEVLSEHGYSLILTNSMGDPRRELENLHALQQRRVDGLLLSVTTETDSRLTDTLDRIDTPMVAIDRKIRATAPIGAVVSDHRTGIAQAVTALHAAGHRSLALIAGLSSMRPGRQRVTTTRRTAKTLGMTCTVRTGTGLAGPSVEELVALLRGPDRPTALIAGNNQILGDVLDALDAAELAYPADLSLVTCDDVPLLRFVRPRIAVVRRDLRELGRQSAKMLVDHIVGDAAALREVRLPTSFETAGSIAGVPSR